MNKRVLGIGSALLFSLVAARAAAADALLHDPDYRKCKRCSEALNKALSYLRENLASSKVSRPISSHMPGYVFSGFAFMMSGDRVELEKCVKHCCKAISQKGYNRNWYLAMCSYFLCEYSLKYGITSEIKTALTEAVKLAEEQQEDTGGWCHHRKMWESTGYLKRGGGEDITMITCIMYASFIEMKKLGIEPGAVMERTGKNLETLWHPNDFQYGTRNGYRDAGMGRSGFVLCALLATGNSDSPFAAKIPPAIEKNFRNADKGHGAETMHYFALAAAMHRMGRETYAKFTAHYIDKLISNQQPDGMVELQIDGSKRAGTFFDAVGSTAVFASLIMMQQEGSFHPLHVKPPEKVAATPAAKVEKIIKPEPATIPLELLKPWILTLQARVVEGLKNGERPRVFLHSFARGSGALKIVAFERNDLLAQLEGGGQINLDWQKLDPRKDMPGLALGFLKNDSASDQILAAAFLFAGDRHAEAEKRLDRLLELEPQTAAEKIRELKKSLQLEP